MPEENNKMIGVYVDNELYNELQIAAKKIGINSVSTYIRFKMVQEMSKKEIA